MALEEKFVEAGRLDRHARRARYPGEEVARFVLSAAGVGAESFSLRSGARRRITRRDQERLGGREAKRSFQSRPPSTRFVVLSTSTQAAPPETAEAKQICITV